MNINEVLKSFQANLSGDYYIMYCPKCGKKEAYCYVEDINQWIEDSTHLIPIRCNRLNKCGVTTYLNDYLKGVSQVAEVKIKEKSPIQMSQEGVKLLQKYCQYIVNSVECNTQNFNFDIRGISNQTLKENGIIYNEKTFQSLINNEKTSQYYGKKYRTSNYLERDMIIPIFNSDNIPERLLLRSTIHEPKEADTYKKEIQVMLVKKGLEIWNTKDLFNNGKRVIFITEGVYDALSIKEVCRNQEVGVIALPGIKKYKQLVKLINKFPKLKEKIYIFSFDADEAGKEFTKKAEQNFTKEGLQYNHLNVKPYKDCNDFLQNNRLALKFRIYKIVHRVQSSKNYEYPK